MRMRKNEDVTGAEDVIGPMLESIRNVNIPW